MEIAELKDSVQKSPCCHGPWDVIHDHDRDVRRMPTMIAGQGQVRLLNPDERFLFCLMHASPRSSPPPETRFPWEIGGH